jgi:beta-glucosidase
MKFFFSLLLATGILCGLVRSACPPGYMSCEGDLCAPNNSTCFKFWDPRLSFDERARDIIARFTLADKAQQMGAETRPIQRLGIRGYNWRTECLHGYLGQQPVNNTGYTTLFPTPINIAATFNVSAVSSMAYATAREARAMNNYYNSKDNYGLHTGLTCWAPVINIARDPRWGRIQESFGECPYMNAKLGVAFVHAMQRKQGNYVTAAAGCKHFDGYSLEDYAPLNASRYSFNAIINERDLRLTYLPAFKACVTRGKTIGVMCSYNAINGVPACANKRFLKDILRTEYKHDGYITSDGTAVPKIYEAHKYTKSMVEAVAAAVINGTQLETPGNTYPANLILAIRKELITEKMMDEALYSLFLTRLMLGEFDLETINPLKKIPLSEANSAKHRELAADLARQSIVLLKNDRNILPVSMNFRTMGLIGPNNNNPDSMGGTSWYKPFTDQMLTPWEYIQKHTTNVIHAPGCWYTTCNTTALFNDAIAVAKKADLIVMFMGLDQKIEREALDRIDITLPGYQEQLIRSVVMAAPGKPIILVLMNGGQVTLSEWTIQNIPVILEAFYPGEEGSAAIFDIIFGKYNPAGRLPYSVPKSVQQLPRMTDMDMKERTYRYSTYEPQWYFGDGMSFTTFKYSNLVLKNQTIRPCNNISLSVDVTNTGNVDGDAVVQVYISNKSAKDVPKISLVAFDRIHLRIGQSATTSLEIEAEWMSQVTNDGKHIIAADHFDVFVGSNHPESKMPTAQYLKSAFSIEGAAEEVNKC